MDSAFRVQSDREFPGCPVCGGVMELVYSRFGENVVVCVDCQTGLTIPRKAWDVAERKKKNPQTDEPGKKVG